MTDEPPQLTDLDPPTATTPPSLDELLARAMRQHVQQTEQIEQLVELLARWEDAYRTQDRDLMRALAAVTRTIRDDFGIGPTRTDDEQPDPPSEGSAPGPTRHGPYRHPSRYGPVCPHLLTAEEGCADCER